MSLFNYSFFISRNFCCCYFLFNSVRHYLRHLKRATNMCRSSYLYTSENINKRLLHVRQKEKIGLSHVFFVFAYRYLFIYVIELVNASSFFSPLTLISSNLHCLSDMQKTLPIGFFICFFSYFSLR